MDLPRYRCHKVVQAAQIVWIERPENQRPTIDELQSILESEGQEVVEILPDGSGRGGMDKIGATLVFEGDPKQSVEVTRRWVEKHDPQIGGYFVIYDDGYQSFSPAKAFEDGYTRIEEPSDAT